ncbi:hypothetical protein ACK3F5_22830 [Photorhabdus asymbiotica UENP]
MTGVSESSQQSSNLKDEGYIVFLLISMSVLIAYVSKLLLTY